MIERVPRSSYAGLGELMRNAGVDAVRVEAMVREFLAMQADEQLIRRQGHELRALRETVGDGLDAIRSDQDSALKALGLALSTFRREADVYQRAFAAATGRTCRLAAIVIVLQLVVIGLCTCLLLRQGPPGGRSVPALRDAGTAPPLRAADSLHFAAIAASGRILARSI